MSTDKVFAFFFRFVSVFFMIVGAYQFSRSVKISAPAKTYFFMTLASVALCQACMQEGQMHMIITGLQLLGLAALTREKWWSGALFIMLSVALKPTSIVIALLALVLYPRVTVKIILLSCAMVVATFLMQHPSYVWHQYLACVNSFAAVFKNDAHVSSQRATLFGAIAFYFHVHVQGLLAFSFRAAFAPLTLGLCYVAGKRFGAKQLAFAILALGMVYLMLFNSRTENNDYIMVMPAIGFTFAYAGMAKARWQIIFHSVVLVLLALNWNLCRLITPHNNLWLNPTLILLYGIYVSILLLKRPVATPQPVL